MYDRLAAGYRYRLRLFLELAGEAEPAAKAARIVAEALGGRDTHALAIDRWLIERSCVWRERARAVVLAAGAASLRAALAQRAERVGGGLGDPPVLFCDASLAALARWLRAAGHDARFRAGAGCLDLAAEALRARGLLLTTDHRGLEFGSVRDGRLPTLWLPSNMTCHEQLRLVIADLDLERAAPRCMACGGALAAANKQSALARIPPRTALWLEAYFACGACERLYWQGTHWEKIEQGISQAFARAPVEDAVASEPELD
jgi:uncharacterized protein with PIN domain